MLINTQVPAKIPSVVFHNEKTPPFPRDGTHGVEDGLHRRGGEDAAADRARKHPLPDEARVGGLVP